jgi:DNA-directed RNA polymerase subunit RPC12/RpoP
MNLDSRLGRPIAVDACTICGMFWFDDLESPQLSPGSILKLFQLIGDGAASPRPARPTALRCPRCGGHLLVTHDAQRQTAFEYWRCDAGHGRLISFYNFLREKNFIRPLSPAQLRELRDNLQTVRCSSCGAPLERALEPVFPAAEPRARRQSRSAARDRQK